MPVTSSAITTGNPRIAQARYGSTAANLARSARRGGRDLGFFPPPDARRGREVPVGGPRSPPPGPGLGVLAREVGAHPHHRLDGDGLGDHELVVAPAGVAEDGLRRLEEVADDAVVARHLLRGAAGDLDRAPPAGHPAVQLVEKLRLQHPLVALAAPAEPVDA